MGLELVEFVMEIEKEFSIEIANADAELLTNLSLLASYVVKTAGYQGRSLDHQAVLQRLGEILVEITAIDPSELYDEADFVRDLGIDARFDIACAVKRKRRARPIQDVL